MRGMAPSISSNLIVIAVGMKGAPGSVVWVPIVRRIGLIDRVLGHIEPGIRVHCSKCLRQFVQRISRLGG